jgi:MFS family permease
LTTTEPVFGPEAAQTTASAATHARRWWILVVLGTCQLMVILDGTVINIAPPTAQHALSFSNANRQWIVAGYALAFGSLLPLASRSATSSEACAP